MLLVSVLFSEEPGPNVVGDGPEPAVGNPRAVHSGHGIIRVAHYEVARGLVSGFVRHRSERMP
jgi:hypothetical protein